MKIAKYLLPLLLTPTLSMASIPLPALGAGGGLGLASSAPEAIVRALKFESAKVWLEKVSVEVSGKLDKPIMVDIVIVYDPNEMLRITQMSSSKSYFLERERFINIEKTKVIVIPVAYIGEGDTAPGAIPIELPNEYPLGAFVFASYDTPALNFASVGTDRHIKINLGSKTFAIETVKP